jgi:hypothetical protein
MFIIIIIITIIGIFNKFIIQIINNNIHNNHNNYNYHLNINIKIKIKIKIYYIQCRRFKNSLGIHETGIYTVCTA